MILAGLIGISLVVTVSIDQATAARPETELAQPPAGMSAHERGAALRRSISSATDCVVRTIAADPRFARSMEAGDITGLIVDSMEPCADQMRAMIDAHDRLYGAGTGEAFFMGPYLDVLPSTIGKRVKGADR